MINLRFCFDNLFQAAQQRERERLLAGLKKAAATPVPYIPTKVSQIEKKAVGDVWDNRSAVVSDFWPLRKK